MRPSPSLRPGAGSLEVYNLARRRFGHLGETGDFITIYIGRKLGILGHWFGGSYYCLGLFVISEVDLGS
jgi:hypothetical protein